MKTSRMYSILFMGAACGWATMISHHDVFADGDNLLGKTPAKCPVIHGNTEANIASGQVANDRYTNQDWWPNRLDLRVLHQNSIAGNPLGPEFDYAKEFAKLDLKALKSEIENVLTTSQDWWPADYGHYGPLMIRLAWHSAGTYRVGDGRGGASDGTIRFAPLNSWPDNANLDKARRLLWPIKQKYGNQISWADLMVLTGNVSLESMGFQTLGFAGGREDVWEPQQDVYWGPEDEWLGDKRYSGDRDLANPLAAVQMGLIYVNPQGPNGNSDPIAAAQDIRETFGRMAMNDEETVALIAGGHTFGKAHGAADPGEHVGPEPEAAGIEYQGLGWVNGFGSGNGKDTITSGLEGAWTSTPVEWSHDYFNNLFAYDWEKTKSPAGAVQWEPVDGGGQGTVPDAHVSEKSHAPIMFTTDLALVQDPAYRKISKRFHENPKEFEEAFAKAWYKLTHRDMGPVARLLGPEVAPPQLWQDPIPNAQGQPITKTQVARLKQEILRSGLSVSDLVSTAWASASTFRNSDKRGGANGARIRLAPQKDWTINQPDKLDVVLRKLAQIQQAFNTNGTGVSIADLIVLGGCAAIEKAAHENGIEIQVPFLPGRTDATQEMTDVDSFAVLEPRVDGFRNYQLATDSRPGERLLVDKAQQLSLNAPEMTVLVGGLRVLNADFMASKTGVFTERPGVLSNDFFINLLDMSHQWKATENGLFEAYERKSGELKWVGTRSDMIFGSNSQLRAIAEVYASKDSDQKFVSDFVQAWVKVMNLDRFERTSEQQSEDKTVAKR